MRLQVLGNKIKQNGNIVSKYRAVAALLPALLAVGVVDPLEPVFALGYRAHRSERGHEFAA